MKKYCFVTAIVSILCSGLYAPGSFEARNAFSAVPDTNAKVTFKLN